MSTLKSVLNEDSDEEQSVAQEIFSSSKSQKKSKREPALTLDDLSPKKSVGFSVPVEDNQTSPLALESDAKKTVIDFYSDRFQQTQSALSNLKKSNEELQDAKSTTQFLKGEISFLKNQLASTEMEKNAMKKSLVASEIDEKKYQSTVEKLKSSNEKKQVLEQVVTGLSEHTKKAANAIEEYKQRNSELERENSTLKNGIEEYERKTQQTIYKLQQMNQEETKSLRKQINSLNTDSKKASMLTESLYKTNEENDLFAKKTKEMTQLNQELLSKVAVLNQKLSDIQSEHAEVSYYSSSLEQTNSQLEAKINILKEQIVTYEKTKGSPLLFFRL